MLLGGNACAIWAALPWRFLHAIWWGMSPLNTHVGSMRLQRPHAPLFIYQGRQSCQAKERGRGPRPAPNNKRISRSSGSILQPKEEGRDATRSVQLNLPTKSANMRSYLIDIGLDIEEPTPERPPPPKRRRYSWNEDGCKYPSARKIFASRRHIRGGDAGALSCRLRVLYFGDGKLEAEHPLPGFDNLVANLDERPPNNWDNPASPEQYIKR